MQEYRPLQLIKRINPESGIEETFYPLQYENVPEQFIKYAEEALNETEEKKNDGILKLKTFLASEKIYCPDDYVILTVLRNCKYNIKKSETKLRRYMKTRQDLAEKLLKVDMKKVETALNELFICLLPYRDKHGRAIIVARSVFTFEGYGIEEYEICYTATLQFVLLFPLTSICGNCYISDAKMPNLYALYPVLNFFRRFVFTMLTNPLRTRKVNIFNESILIKWFLAVIRPFVPEKIMKRLSLHGSNYEELKKFYHSDILPKEFGGNMGPLSNGFYREQILDFMENLKKEYLQYREKKTGDLLQTDLK